MSESAFGVTSTASTGLHAIAPASKGPDTLTFTTPRRSRQPLTFLLDGREFLFTPPKKAGIVLAYMEDNSGARGDSVGAFFDWFGQGLSTEDNEFIVARLKDPDDDLDIDTITEIARGLLEKVSQAPSKP